jgi:hypothetical protein
VICGAKNADLTCTIGSPVKIERFIGIVSVATHVTVIMVTPVVTVTALEPTTNQILTAAGI